VGEDVTMADHPEESASAVPVEADEAEAAMETETVTGAGGAAQSYKCDVCGKILKNINAVQLHGETTKHESFR
jgi:hypothetical protein